MAFLNKIGNILKHGVGKNTNLELSASNGSLFQTIRSMSSSKLFVGGLSYGTDESSLKETFSQYGEVIEARVILDRETGRSRGFGFISFPSSEEATSAMQAMDGQDLHGRRIKVNYATEKRRDGFGGGYGGGNYGGEGGNFAGGGGYAASNYGGGGGGFSGGYNSSGGGGYNSAGGSGYGSSSGYTYGGEGGNVAGSGGYPTNNYGGGGTEFSSGNSSAGGYSSYGGGSSNYGNNSSPVEGGNYGSSTPNINHSGQGSSFSGGYGGGNSGNDFVGAPSNNNSFANTGFGGSSEASYNGSQEQVSADQGTQSINEHLGQETPEGNYRDNDDKPKDYANTRG
ncbi:RNA-binding protein precursor [Solanum tuberosum]|uniref:RNA-binding protein n=2 Tax=Solanum tuberosum TaxID=4113 RepID=Q941H8_SOLTU|nr:RNA-binding protein precursor [Solanum tuberosum]AAL07519.1 RNA-binding protein precursor [Solanum tuberosum]KAH0697608.1 hypothetical protein KY289_015090 [Solanum tuberosum]KAH0700626.1 hypothetical protein KY284_014841 [Solanum tuberosum]KAH0718835.1 hypothetical protein KY285_014866 [Solanum tuberosum]